MRTTLLASWLVVVVAFLPSTGPVPAAVALPAPPSRPRCVVVHEPVQHPGAPPPRSAGSEIVTLSIPRLRCDAIAAPGGSSRSADRLPRTGTELVLPVLLGLALLGAGGVMVRGYRSWTSRHARRRRHAAFRR